MPQTPEPDLTTPLGDPLDLTATIGLVEPPIDVRVDELLMGRTFTHRLTAIEIDRDVLPITPDFTAFWPMIEIAPFDTINGRPFVEFFDQSADNEQAALRLEPGTLAGFSADSLIAIRIADDGFHLDAPAEVNRVNEPTLIAAARTEVARIFGNRPADGDEAEHDAVDVVEAGSAPLDEFLQLICLRDAAAFTEPSRPVADLLVELGLDHDHGSIALSGFDFASEVDEEFLQAEHERVVETYELADDEAAAVLAFSGLVADIHDAVHEWIEDGSDVDTPPTIGIGELIPVLPLLAEPMVCVAIADENLTDDPHLGEILGMILGALESELPRSARPGWHWLQGRCADLLADFAAAEAGYRTALQLAGDFYPAMRELATLASLRGEANQAVSLLQRAAIPADDPELAVVSRFVGEERSDVGRNEPCWCGSGRKYKHCHLGKSDFDLAARRDWLYEKVSGWVRSGRGRELIVEMAQAAIDLQNPDSVFDLVLDPLIMDLALFEGGLAEEFLAERAGALPADERDLLQDWTQTNRGLYTVEMIDGSTGLTLGDAATGTSVTVEGPTAGLKVGDLVTARLLPPTGPLAATGGVHLVAPAQRELTLAVLAQQGTDEDPVRLAQVLLAR